MAKITKKQRFKLLMLFDRFYWNASVVEWWYVL